MAKTNVIGRLAVSLDLFSANFSKKVNAAAAKAKAAKKPMQDLTKSVKALQNSFVAIKVMEFVGQMTSFQTSMRESVEIARDFNNLIGEDSRAALMALGEEFDAFDQRQSAALTNGRAQLANVSYAWENAKTSIIEALGELAPNSTNPLITQAAIDQIKRDRPELIAEVERTKLALQKAQNESAFGPLSSLFSGAQENYKKANEAFNSAVIDQSEKNQRAIYESNRKIFDTKLKLQRLGFRRAIMSRKEYNAERLRLNKDLLREEINLANNDILKQNLIQQLNDLDEVYRTNLAKFEERSKEKGKSLIESFIYGNLEEYGQIAFAHNKMREKLRAAANGEIDGVSINSDQLNAGMDAINDSMNNAFDKLDLKNKTSDVKMLAGAFSTLGAAMKQMGMEGTAAFKVVNIAGIVADASSAVFALLAQAQAKSLAELPFPANFAAYAQIIAASASIGSVLGQAHSGLDRVPREGTYLLDQDEMVLNKQDAQAVRSGEGLPGKGNQAQSQNITINPTIQSSGRDRQSDMQLMEEMKMSILNDIMSNGDIGRAIRGNI